MANKEEIAQNEQFLLLSPCFQHYSIIVPVHLKDPFHFFTFGYVLKVVCCRFVVCGKALIDTEHFVADKSHKQFYSFPIVQI